MKSVLVTLLLLIQTAYSITAMGRRQKSDARPVYSMLPFCSKNVVNNFHVSVSDACCFWCSRYDFGESSFFGLFLSQNHSPPERKWRSKVS